MRLLNVILFKCSLRIALIVQLCFPLTRCIGNSQCHGLCGIYCSNTLIVQVCTQETPMLNRGTPICTTSFINFKHKVLYAE